MADFVGKMLFWVLRILIEDCLKEAALKVCAWLDTQIHGRTARIVIGGLLGLAAYVIYPIIRGLFE
jgi:hypothetical protein